MLAAFQTLSDAFQSFFSHQHALSKNKYDNLCWFLWLAFIEASLFHHHLLDLHQRISFQTVCYCHSKRQIKEFTHSMSGWRHIPGHFLLLMEEKRCRQGKCPAFERDVLTPGQSRHRMRETCLLLGYDVSFWCLNLLVTINIVAWEN